MPVLPVILGIVIVLSGIVVGRLAIAWLKYRGRRAITCPENLRPAGVRVNAGLAARTALGGAPELRLADCSRWPERAGCGQQCLAEITASPEGCLVRKILAKWYEGKVCASCGRAFGEIDWAGQEPALIGSDKVSVEWNQIPADKLHQVLAASLPLCFACHLANTLVRAHPELVVDRSIGRLI